MMTSPRGWLIEVLTALIVFDMLHCFLLLLEWSIVQDSDKIAQDQLPK